MIEITATVLLTPENMWSTSQLISDTMMCLIETI